MTLIIADRVKEATVTSGTGSLTLSGATFGGFQTFADSIGDGNSTYYCIQNNERFEIGLGTYSSSSNTLSRDTVFQSSNSDNKINLVGASIVFCVVPADKLIYTDETDTVVFPTPFIFKRSDDGDYWQALSSDYTNRVASFYIEEGVDPTWKIGLKTNSSDIIAPYYAYVSAKDGFVELRGNSSSILSVGDGNSEGLKVSHQLKNIIDIRKNGGEIAIQNLDLNSDETTTAKNSSIAYTVFAVESSASHAADLQTWSVSTDELASVNQYGDFETVGNIISPSGRFSAIRFSDSTIQTTAALPFASGSLIDQNTQSIISNSGYFQTYIDGLDHSATAVSGWAEDYIELTSGNLQSQVNQNVTDISAVSGLIGDADFLPGSSGSLINQNASDIISNSGYFESRINDSDSSLSSTSGYFESRTNTTDNNLNVVSGLLTPSGESFNFAGNVLTYNNSDGGSFTADLSSLSTFDTSGVGLGYSNGILTYTNNAGGSFDVDISSISGDVYAMIVDGAPTTLDTLNEIAAALNDDANVANTLTTLISTTSGNLQSQITGNDNDISQLNSDVATVSGIASKTFTITASSSSNYTFDGMGLSSAADPTIYLHKGHTYYFDKQTSSHPFRISDTQGGSVYQDADGNNIEINGQGILTFEVPQDAPDKLYYYCTSHASMNGVIYTTTDGSLSGYFESRANQSDSDISTVSGLLSTVGDRFTSDITVSLGGGKTFGRYGNGDTIPSSGLKPSQVISLAVTEPIAPTASLTSSSTVDFNQVNVSTTLNFSHTINSLGATVASASLEFRRGNSGSWTVLSTSTSASSSYNHTFTDTAFNTAVLNYRYTVTDTAGATITVTKNINPDTYSAPTISFSVAAVSTTSPESNSSRERGNVNSNISGSINRNETYVDLISYTLQYSVNGGAWTDVGSAVSIGPGNSTISTTNHNPTSNNTATSIRYRVEVVDDYTTSYSSISTVSFGFLVFYGAVSSVPTTSANVRALPSRLFTTGNNTFTLNTGSTEVNFTVAIPSTETISEVIDLDALNANITSQYVNNPFNVDDAGGTAVSYNVYTMTQATAYSSNHRHQVTKG